MTGRGYRIEVSRHARRALLALPPEVSARIEAKIDGLARNPRPRGVKKLGGKEIYRPRVGDHRVIYHVQDRVLVVLVVDVGHRRDVYRR